MEGAGNQEKSKNEPPLLRIDPTCLKDALRAFFQPIKNGDPRLDFYTVYEREASQYDVDYVKKYDEDLNTTLIFAGLFSAVSSAFVIDIYPKLQPNSNDQSAVLLRAILLALNQSSISNEFLTLPPAQQSPAGEIVAATALLYASLLISLLAAFIAMLGKQWLNRYLRHAGGSMIERCGDRQRKCDGLKKWPFHLFVESLPVMLQVALLLLACGLCRHMASVNTTIAYILITLTGLGVLFYVGIVIAGASSYDCPFQSPASVPLRGLWKKIRPSWITVALPAIITLRTLRETFERRVFRILVHLPHFDILCYLRSFSERVQLGILRVGFYLSPIGFNIRPSFHHPLLPTTLEESPSPISQEVIPWFALGELAKIQMKNTNDVWCVSWVIRNITDPEALDAAIRRAGTIRWFDDGIDVEPVYDLIVSTFHACFGSDGEVYPGSRDRAYYSGRAVLWIHTLSMCKSRTFPLLTTRYRAKGFYDLQNLLRVIQGGSAKGRFEMLLVPLPKSTLSHSRWVSNVLLNQSWAQITPGDFSIHHYRRSIHKISIPLVTLLNCSLMCCNLLGFPVDEEVLKIQDKSDRSEQVLNHLTRTINSALNSPHPRYEPIGIALVYLAKLESRPPRSAKLAYGWCAVIWENRQGCKDWENLLFLSLEVGFRRYDPQEYWHAIDLNHTEHHRELADVVFKSNRIETIADLLCSLTMRSRNEPAVRSFDFYKQYIIDIHNNVTVPFSPRLQRIIMRSIILIGYRGLEEEMGIERLFGLLNQSHIGVEERRISSAWGSFLLETVKTLDGHLHLTVQSWEILVKLAASDSSEWTDTTYTPHVTSYLLSSQEWRKLECWIGVVWMVSPPKTNDVEDLKHAMTSLFRKRPGAVRKLARWMQQWGEEHGENIPESFQPICEQANEAALSSLLPDQAREDFPRPSPPGSDRFWELLPLI